MKKSIWKTAVTIAIMLFTLSFSHSAISQEWHQEVSESPMRETPPLPEEFFRVVGQFITVHGPPESVATLTRLAEHGDSRIEVIAAELGVNVSRRIEVVLTQSDAQFRALQPGAIPRWADATAWPRRSWIFLRANRLRGGTARADTIVLDHEITHVLLGQAFDLHSPPQPVPQWLQEGLSQWISGEYTPDTTRRIARGLLGRGLLSLDELSRSFPRDPVRATLAYAQSADLIAWIAGEYGEEAVRSLVHSMAKGEPFRASIRIATGHSASEIDAEWRERLENSTLWLEAIANDGLIMALGGIFLIAGWLGVRRRNKKKLAQWAKEEAIEDELARVLLGQVDVDELTTEEVLCENSNHGEWIH
jgi:hypothetical protein